MYRHIGWKGRQEWVCIDGIQGQCSIHISFPCVIVGETWGGRDIFFLIGFVFLFKRTPVPEVCMNHEFTKPRLHLLLLRSYTLWTSLPYIFSRLISDWRGNPPLPLLSLHIWPPHLSLQRIIYPHVGPLSPSQHAEKSLPPLLLSTWDTTLTLP